MLLGDIFCKNQSVEKMKSLELRLNFKLPWQRVGVKLDSFISFILSILKLYLTLTVKTIKDSMKIVLLSTKMSRKNF